MDDEWEMSEWMGGEVVDGGKMEEQKMARCMEGGGMS